MRSGKSPAVSIVIPVYNAESYLRECLDSVLRQTLDDIEVLCVNDGSTDTSLAILRDYAARDVRLRIIDKPNGGVSSARNAAYPHLRGKYTYFADADDCLDPTLCSKAFFAAEHIQADVCCFFFGMEGRCKADPIDVPLSVVNPNEKLRNFLLSRINGGPCSKFFRTAFLLDNDLTFPPYRIGEDQLVHWRACLLAKRVAICPEQLYWYRQHPMSAMRSGGEKCFDVIEVFELIKEFLIGHGLFEHYRETYLAMKLDHLYLECHSMPRSLYPLRQKRLQEALGANEFVYLHSGKAPGFFKDFFLSMGGDRLAGLRYRLFLARRRFLTLLGLDWLKRTMRMKLQGKFNLASRDRVLCDAIAKLRAEIVQSRSPARGASEN